jgi:uncharacterized protein (DUF427 family)
MRVIEALEAERVQDYPRPPALERVVLRVRVVLGGATVADSTESWRVCETHHAPTYYLPPEDVTAGVLTPARGSSFCEWKGRAAYWDVTAGGVTRPRAAWSYPTPTAEFSPIAGYLAFYPGLMDECRVGETQVTPQPGDFYGGWVTPNLQGTVKGGPGTRWW